MRRPPGLIETQAKLDLNKHTTPVGISLAKFQSDIIYNPGWARRLTEIEVLVDRRQAGNELVLTSEFNEQYLSSRMELKLDGRI